MVAVLLLMCIAMLGICTRAFTDAVLDLRKPVPQRIHSRNYPRLLIWGVIGSLFGAAMLLLGFPKDTAIALIIVSIGMGVLTSVVSHLKLLKRFQI